MQVISLIASFPKDVSPKDLKRQAPKKDLY